MYIYMYLLVLSGLFVVQCQFNWEKLLDGTTGLKTHNKKLFIQGIWVCIADISRIYALFFPLWLSFSDVMAVSVLSSIHIFRVVLCVCSKRYSWRASTDTSTPQRHTYRVSGCYQEWPTQYSSVRYVSSSNSTNTVAYYIFHISKLIEWWGGCMATGIFLVQSLSYPSPKKLSLSNAHRPWSAQWAGSHCRASVESSVCNFFFTQYPGIDHIFLISFAMNLWEYEWKK